MRRDDYPFETIRDEPVTRDAWNEMFIRWKTRTLRREWAQEHPDLFDVDDLKINQPDKWFAEWYAAILLKQSSGMLSLVGKYGHHGHKSHPRKQSVLSNLLSAEQHRYVITDPKNLFEHSTGWPDLFVYKPDHSSCFFCEVKGPNDVLRPLQIPVFECLRDATGLDVVLFQFHWAT